MGTYREAFEVIQNFCKVNATLSVGTVNCGQISFTNFSNLILIYLIIFDSHYMYEAIKGYGNLTENTKKMWM